MGEGYNLSLLLGNISSVKASGIFSNSEDPLSGLAIHGGKMGSTWTGVEPSPCFSIFLARTTFVLESLPEAKNPGQDAIFEDFVLNSSSRGCYGLID